MPLDGNPAHVNELLLLDDMTKYLADEKHWCRFKLYRFNYDGRMQVCLYGALNVADHGTVTWHQNQPFHFQTKAAGNIHKRIIRRVAPIRSFMGSRCGGMWFNDRKRTTHADVLRLLSELRQQFAK